MVDETMIYCQLFTIKLLAIADRNTGGNREGNIDNQRHATYNAKMVIIRQ